MFQSRPRSCSVGLISENNNIEGFRREDVSKERSYI